MKKSIVKISSIATMLFLFNLNVSFAQQKTTSDFVGVWEKIVPKQKLNTGQEIALFHNVKIFNADGSFSNLNIFPESSVISHAGTYKIDGDAYYENILETNVNNSVDDSQKLTFRFSDDKQTLFLSGTLKGKDGDNSVIAEAWKKLNIKK